MGLGTRFFTCLWHVNKFGDVIIYNKNTSIVNFIS